MAGTPRSCTSCRQAKVACDARKKPSNTPCTRCTRNQLECRFDKNFKRILTRKLTASLTNELHQLRTSQIGSEVGRDEPSPLGIQLRESASLSSDRFPFLFTNVTEPLPDFSIGNVTIPSNTIIELIQHFGYQYHPHAHFIQPIESLADFYTASPLLFWTIVLLASHCHIEHSGLYEKLLLPHEKLLRPFSNTAIQSIHEIHALLLLCLWPIPRRLEASNPTWNYIGLAVNACMRLDLNKAATGDPLESRSNTPEHDQRPEKISIQTRRLTWLACLAISTQEATFLGFLPPLSSRPYLKQSRKAVDEMKDHLLPNFKPKFAIYEIICNYSLVLEEIDGSSAQLSLVETFDRSLDMIRQTYSAQWTTDVDVLLQYAKLNLNATALMRILVENEEASSLQFAEIQTLIIQGSEASWRLINDMKTMINEALAPDRQPAIRAARITTPMCYPRFYSEVMFFAAVFIFRTSYMRPVSSHHTSTAGLIEMCNMCRLFPQHKDMTNGADFIQHLLCYASSDEFPYISSPMGGLATTNRLGASFVWDTATHFTQILDRKVARQLDGEHQEPRAAPHAVAGPSTAVQSAITDGILGETGGLQLQDAINMDWADINLPLPIFDIFGLEAGEHITW
ncbi:hypothetical protein F5Y01DRAFT_272766 [Xylaria sp. FL0043]|nr:hypothetical protein F5Y01DRAFT_272766 [Xylaria sp. FL0043]